MEVQWKEVIRMTQCWFCGHQMIWGSDTSFDDLGMEGDGIVAFLSCSSCSAIAEFYLPERDDDPAPISNNACVEVT